MKASEKIARLRLSRTSSIGFITFYKLLERYGTAEKAIQMLPQIARRGGRLSDVSLYSEEEALREIEEAEKVGARLLVNGEDEYPKSLAEIEDAPPVITVLGNIEILNRPGLGIVGSRNSSAIGRKVCAELAEAVSSAGYVVVSGLARGIDTIAHKAAVEGGTVAVVAGGVDIIYPRDNETLYNEIIEKNGAIVSENYLGCEPVASLFPKRNRIISGLSLGVLVIEAALKSGSLITARTALEQNREVFAVPGSPKDPRAEGTNRLIKDGAHMVTSAEDIIAELDALSSRSITRSPAKSWKQESFNLEVAEPETEVLDDVSLQSRILSELTYTPIQLDDLIREIGVPAAQIMPLILELELEGKIVRHVGNKVSLA